MAGFLFWTLYTTAAGPAVGYLRRGRADPTERNAKAETGATSAGTTTALDLVATRSAVLVWRFFRRAAARCPEMGGPVRAHHAHDHHAHSH
jgi:hypothetical protein